MAWRSLRLSVASVVVISLAMIFGAPRPEVARGALAVVAVPDVLSMKHDRTAVVPAPGVLGNDLNLLGSTTAILVSNPSHGSVNLRSDGGYTYTPTPGYVGTDVFRYRPSGLLSNTTTVTITITNAAPVGVADSYTATAGVLMQVPSPGILANDVDADGDTLTATLVGGATHGLLSLSPNGGFTYTANASYSGFDSFTYRAWDGISSSATTAVSLVVNAPTPSPTPTPTPSPSATPTPPTSGPSPTPAPSVFPSMPVPSVPMPSLPMPSLPLPSASISPSPGASLPLPSLPLSSPSANPSLGVPQPSASQNGPTPSPGIAGGGVADGGGGSSHGGGAAGPVAIGPGGLGVRTTPAGTDRLGVAGLGNLSTLELWLVPGAVIAGPGLLVLLWLAIQVLAGMVWLPAARRVRGQDDRGRRTLNR